MGDGTSTGIGQILTDRRMSSSVDMTS